MNPPFSSCPNCHADLRVQLPSEAEPVFSPEAETRYFYDRAMELTLAKNDDEALATIARGLSRLETSELHLLAALIHRKRQEYEQMRGHVAAIPAGDSLRSEAEWLLHSHQEQQRKLRREVQQSGRGSAPSQSKAPLNSENQPASNEFEQNHRRHKRGHRRLWGGAMVALLAVVLLWQAPLLERWSGALFLDLNSLVMPAVRSENAQEILGEETTIEETTIEELTVEEATEETEPLSQSLEAVEPAPVIPESVPTLEPTSEPTSEPTLEPTPAPTPLPTATHPPDIVEVQPPSLEPIAANGTTEALLVVSTTEQPVFDIAPYLELFGRADLSELDLNARRQGETLVLEGVVTSTQQRNDLLELARRMPGVEDVNGIDLLIRLPGRYVVEEADTLWSISIKLYGDESRWKEILDANQEQLGDGTLLVPGQELIVPPLQGNQ